MTESWSEGSWGETPWGGGVITVTPDSIEYCPCVYLNPIFLSPTYCIPTAIASAEARLTVVARANLARAVSEGVAFQVKEFSVGRGGFNLENPLEVTEVEELKQTLIDEIYRAPIEDIDWANNKSATFLMRLNDDPQFEVYSVLGEVGLWAQIEYSFKHPHEVGSWFLFATAHIPMLCLAGQAHSFRLTVQF